MSHGTKKDIFFGKIFFIKKKIFKKKKFIFKKKKNNFLNL